MKLIQTDCLSESQQTQVCRILNECSRHDGCLAALPDTDVLQHYLLLAPDETLCSILTVCRSPEFDDELECIAYTAPLMRRQGYFSRLLEQCMEDFEETDLVFPVNHRSAAALDTIKALQADCLSTEYRMEYRLGELSAPDSSTDFDGRHSIAAHPDALSLTENAAGCWLLTADDIPVCQCRTAFSGTGVCLYDVETEPTCRNQGFAAALLTRLFPRLQAAGADCVFLHVSGTNEPAMALYKKTGFRITETLSYYLY